MDGMRTRIYRSTNIAITLLVRISLSRTLLSLSKSSIVVVGFVHVSIATTAGL